MADPKTFTRFMERARNGDESAREKAFEYVYGELRALARGRLRGAANSIQPTELVHEMYARLVDRDRIDWKDRSEFFGLASRAMRDILVERARAATAKKRGGEVARVPLTSAVTAAEENPETFLTLDNAISRLSEKDPLAADVVRMRYFIGLSGDETAEVLDVSASTVDRRWKYARAWLHEVLYG